MSLSNRNRRQILCYSAALFAVLGIAGEALAHIPSQSPYHPSVDEAAWAQVSLAIFLAGQGAGFAYLLLLLIAYRRGPVWKNLGLALLFQLVIAGLLFIAGGIAFLMAAGFSRDLHIVATPIEIATVVRPEMIPNLLFANLLTFALCVGLGWLLLLTIRPLRKNWLVPFIHTLVYHPLVFPVGIVVGVIHAIYVFRTPAEKHAAED
ncbi:MAG: hypothetical protein WD851_23130 [Pirellulales bacterium]